MKYQLNFIIKKTLIHNQSTLLRQFNFTASHILLSIKRGFEVTTACFLLILLTPLILFLLILVSIDFDGSPIYVQTRRGYKGNIFSIYKFRTMMADAHNLRAAIAEQEKKNSILFKFDHDERITKIGAFLRKYSLDELPQLLNVIKGDMSLVGPRPFSLEVFEQKPLDLLEYQHWVRERHQMRPGMTGLWQISGRNDLSDEELIRLDLEYVRGWTLGGDFLILFRTLPVVLSSKGAY